MHLKTETQVPCGKAETCRCKKVREMESLRVLKTELLYQVSL